MTRTRTVFVSSAAVFALLALAACGPPPPAPPPDPLVSCDSLAVSLSYSPPATNGADDVTGTVQVSSGLSGCTDFTGRSVTAASLVGSIQIEGACSYHPPGEPWAWGTGQLTWSDGSTSDWAGELVAETPFRADIRLTGGLWAGATASLPMAVTGVVGDCSAGGITEVGIGGGPFVLHPAGAAVKQPLTGVEQMAAGGYHSCAVVDATNVKCWGDNTYGQLGTGMSGPGPTADELVPTDVVGLGAASQVTTGENHTCALVAGGGARCWGANGVGQLGNGSTISSDLPVEVTGLSGATDISAGNRETCAVVAGGAVSCWGDGSPAPALVPGISGATAVSVGGSHQGGSMSHACALVAAGAVTCWGGNNSQGQLGDGTNTSSGTPVPVVGITGATALVAGPYGSSCAVVGGGVSCWGNNDYGQLGDGTTNNSNVPVQVVGLSTATDVGLGAVHACARLSDGSAKCWGNNLYGQLGAGAIAGTTTPVAVTGMSDATAIAVGDYFTCAERAGGSAACWGVNGDGQLGTGNRVGANTPGPVIAAF
jgi:alpha-tubulin suppressor-like RCC1 family protein